MRILPALKPILDYVQVTGEIFTHEEVRARYVNIRNRI